MKMTKRIASFLLSLIMLASAGAFCASAEEETAALSAIPEICTDGDLIDYVQLTRGINLSGWESRFSSTSYIAKESTYTNIASKGFDHVRIPIDFRNLYSASTGKLDETKMKSVDTAIDYAVSKGLSVLLDFHGWYNINISDATQKSTFVGIWTALSERYAGKSERLMFELINEPHDTEGGNLTASNLNSLQSEVIGIIRQKNPNRIIVAASAEWNGSWTLKDLVLPANDRNIIVAVHCYAPLDFTHQGATWSDPTNTKQVRLTDAMLGDFDGQMNTAFTWAKNNNRKIILNEFGVYLSVADHGDVTKYLTHAVNACTANKVPYTYWEYNSGFGAYSGTSWKSYVIDGLFPSGTPEKVRITLDGRDGSTPAAVEYNFGDTIEFPTLTMTGRTFLGWGNTPNATVTTTDTKAGAARTYYALWKYDDVTVWDDAVFVSGTYGDDSNPGTSAAFPFKTLAKAQQYAASHEKVDTVYFVGAYGDLDATDFEHWTSQMSAEQKAAFATTLTFGIPEKTLKYRGYNKDSKATVTAKSMYLTGNVDIDDLVLRFLRDDCRIQFRSFAATFGRDVELVNGGFAQYHYAAPKTVSSESEWNFGEININGGTYSGNTDFGMGSQSGTPVINANVTYNIGENASITVSPFGLAHGNESKAGELSVNGIYRVNVNGGYIKYLSMGRTDRIFSYNGLRYFTVNGGTIESGVALTATAAPAGKLQDGVTVLEVNDGIFTKKEVVFVEDCAADRVVIFNNGMKEGFRLSDPNAYYIASEKGGKVSANTTLPTWNNSDCEFVGIDITTDKKYIFVGNDCYDRNGFVGSFAGMKDIAELSENTEYTITIPAAKLAKGTANITNIRYADAVPAAVTFSYDGKNETYLAAVGTVITKFPSAAVPEGKILAGWKAQNADDSTAAGSYTVAGDVTLVPVFASSVVKHKVTFTNYDDSVLSSGEYAEGAAVTLPAAPDSPDETYAFDGWYIGAEKLTSAVTVGKTDITVKAVFRKIGYKLTVYEYDLTEEDGKILPDGSAKVFASTVLPAGTPLSAFEVAGDRADKFIGCLLPDGTFCKSAEEFAATGMKMPEEDVSFIIVFAAEGKSAVLVDIDAGEDVKIPEGALSVILRTSDGRGSEPQSYMGNSLIFIVNENEKEVYFELLGSGFAENGCLEADFTGNTSVKLTYVAGDIPGSGSALSGDGVIDTADFVRVLHAMEALGADKDADVSDADLNFDGIVTVADLAIVKANLGLSAAVQKPSLR